MRMRILLPWLGVLIGCAATTETETKSPTTDEPVTCEDVPFYEACSTHADCGTGLACVESGRRMPSFWRSCSDGSSGGPADSRIVHECAPGIECSGPSPAAARQACELDAECAGGETCNLLPPDTIVPRACTCDKVRGAWDCGPELVAAACGTRTCAGENPQRRGCASDLECSGGQVCRIVAQASNPGCAPLACTCTEGAAAWDCSSSDCAPACADP